MNPDIIDPLLATHCRVLETTIRTTIGDPSTSTLDDATLLNYSLNLHWSSEQHPGTAQHQLSFMTITCPPFHLDWAQRNDILKAISKILKDYPVLNEDPAITHLTPDPHLDPHKKEGT